MSDPKVNTKVSNTFKKLPTKSSQIRYLNSQGYSRGDIAKILTKHYYPKGGKEVRYQHVRNVLITPIQNEKK